MLSTINARDVQWDVWVANLTLHTVFLVNPKKAVTISKQLVVIAVSLYVPMDTMVMQLTISATIVFTILYKGSVF